MTSPSSVRLWMCLRTAALLKSCHCLLLLWGESLQTITRHRIRSLLRGERTSYMTHQIKETAWWESDFLLYACFLTAHLWGKSNLQANNQLSRQGELPLRGARGVFGGFNQPVLMTSGYRRLSLTVKERKICPCQFYSTWTDDEA